MSIVYRDPSNGNKYPYTGYPINSQNQVVTFTSSDTTDANASSWTNVATLTSGERHKSIFAKISQMFKNVRYLYKLLGTTDFSGLGSDVSGALSNIGGIVVKGVEKTSTASQAYAVNEYLVYNKKLYRVKAAIAKNATITVGTNVDSANTNVGAELTILNSALTTLENKPFKYSQSLGNSTGILKITCENTYQFFFIVGQKGLMMSITEMNGSAPEYSFSAKGGLNVVISATATKKFSININNTSYTSYIIMSNASFTVE